MATTETRAPSSGSVLGGEQVETGETYEVRSPYDGAPVAVVHRAGPDEIEAAIAGAVEAFETTRQTSVLAARARSSSGSPTGSRRGARTSRARSRSRRASRSRRRASRPTAPRSRSAIAAEEAKRIYGEIVPLDWLPGNEGRVAQVRRVPLGADRRASRPFNFPLNLVAHKVAPALAAGNPIVLRPAIADADQRAQARREIVLEAGWPEDAIAVVPCSTEDAAPLVEDERIKLLTFTGSPAVGWGAEEPRRPQARDARARRQRGGDRRTPTPTSTYAAERIAWGGFAYAGQTCISVQRVYVHDVVYDGFDARARRAASRRSSVGDPLDEATDVGPVIDARRRRARSRSGSTRRRTAGATVLAGGERDGHVCAADRRSPGAEDD